MRLLFLNSEDPSQPEGLVPPPAGWHYCRNRYEWGYFALVWEPCHRYTYAIVASGKQDGVFRLVRRCANELEPLKTDCVSCCLACLVDEMVTLAQRNYSVLLFMEQGTTPDPQSPWTWEPDVGQLHSTTDDTEPRDA